MFSRIPALRPFLLLVSTLVLPALACQLSFSTASITNGVMARDVQGDNFDPVGITDSFPANTSVLHAVVTISNAPSDTAVKIIWLDSSNNSIGEYELKTEGSRNLDFAFKPNAGGLPSGNYKAEIYLNGKLDRTLNFAVAAAPTQPTAAPIPTAAAQAQPTVAPIPTAAAQATARSPKPTGYINNVTLAESTTGDKEPVNPTTVFKPTAVFHAVVRSQSAPANTKFKASWYVVDVGNAAAPNSLLTETELATDGSRYIDFSISPPETWPIGTYRVEISVNGVVDTVKTFSVK